MVYRAHSTMRKDLSLTDLTDIIGHACTTEEYNRASAVVLYRGGARAAKRRRVFAQISP